MQPVLVTDASERAALAVIRSLGKRRIDVVATDSTRFNTGFMSKYCSRRIICPPPQKSMKRYADFILQLVKNEKFDLLIPATDFSMITILENQDRIENYVKIATPPTDVAVKALDKLQTIKIAEKCGIPCPRTFLPRDIKELREVGKNIQYPCVIKPRSKVLWIKDRAVMLKVTQMNYANNCIDLQERYSHITAPFKGSPIPDDFFMVQELAPGKGFGVELLMHDSQVKGLFMHKRIREYPLSGGASTYRVSEYNQKLGEYAVNLLTAMGWEGLAMVEFKLDEESGKVSLMEVNGRLWGSLSLAVNAGVDFPFLLYRVMVYGDVPACRHYRIGVKQRWLIPGDLLWLFTSVRNGPRRMLPALLEFMSSSFADDIISRSDILPTLGVTFDTMRYFLDVVGGRRAISGETSL